MTYVALANITLGSSASSVTFSSIPATFRDLVLVIAAATSVASNNALRVNSDTGSNYSRVFMAGNASTPSSGTGGGGTSLQIDQAAFSGTTVGEQTTVLHFLDYSATDKHKTMLIRQSRTGSANGAEAIAGRWANTAALTSISFFSLTGGTTWSAGSRFDLYGIAS